MLSISAARHRSRQTREDYGSCTDRRVRVKRFGICRLFGAFGVAPLLGISCSIEGSNGMDRGEIATIKKVIETAYVEGVHERQDIEAVKAGFHPEFRMMVLNGNAVTPVAVDEWLARVDGLKDKNPDLWSEPTKIEYETVDITGRSAVVKLSVFKGKTFFSTDYMFLYRLDDGWKIVSKIFVTEPTL